MRHVLDSIAKTNFDPKGYLTGKLLVATPFMADPRFEHAVVYLCSHDQYGAIGLVINKLLHSLTFTDLLAQLEIPASAATKKIQLYSGGPVEVSRGFVLHSCDYKSEATVRVGENFYITATLDILRALSQSLGPKHFLLMLGYAGWGANQLEQEIHENLWMIVDPTEDLLFNTSIDMRWRATLASLGVDPCTLSMEAGRA